MKFKLIFILSMICLSAASQTSTPACISGDCTEGYGVKTYPDGGYEKGEWHNGKLNGKGEQFFGDSSDFAGDTYIGEFKNGRYHGHGVYTDVSESITFDGEWLNGAPIGDKISKVNLDKKTAIISEDLEWDTIVNSKYSFQIMFPIIKGTKIEEKESIEEDTEFGDITKTSINLNCQKSGHVNLAYSVTILEIGTKNFENFSSDDYKNYFKKTESILENVANCKSITKTVIDSSDYFGREILFKNERYNLRIKTRIIVRNGFEYRINVIIPETEYFNPYVNMFLNSFRFN